MWSVCGNINQKQVTKNDETLYTFTWSPEMSSWSSKTLTLVSSSHWTAATRPRVFSLAQQGSQRPPHRPAYRLPSQTFCLRRAMPTPSTTLNRLSSIRRHLTMNAQELKHFLADSPPSTVNLEIKKHFDALTDQQARYAHFISRYNDPSPIRHCTIANSYCTQGRPSPVLVLLSVKFPPKASPSMTL
jgi:hypothetical protein